MKVFQEGKLTVTGQSDAANDAVFEVRRMA